MRVCAGRESWCWSAGRVSSPCIPHAHPSDKWLRGKTPQRVHLQRKMVRAAAFLKALCMGWGKWRQINHGEKGDGDLLSLRGSQAAGFHPTRFYNIIFTWVDGAGCAARTRCVCCGRSHCWSSNRVCFVLTGAMGHSPSWAETDAAQNRPELLCACKHHAISKHTLMGRHIWSRGKAGMGKQGCLHKACSGLIPSVHSQSPLDTGRPCENRKEFIMSVRFNIWIF